LLFFENLSQVQHSLVDEFLEAKSTKLQAIEEKKYKKINKQRWRLHRSTKT